MKDEQISVRATITRILYSERGRLIARVAMDPSARKMHAGERLRLDSVLGSMTEPRVGQMYEFCGPIKFDAKFKQYQMQFESYRTILPTDRDGIANYLIDVASWVGPATATKLIEAFGADTLTVIKEQPDRVIALGLPAERVAEMSRSLIENAALEAGMIELNNLLNGAIGPAMVRKALKKWGSDAATLVKGNAFLLTELHGVGFASADAVHTKIGGQPKDLNRHLAALCHVLHEASQTEGHTIMSRDMVEMHARRLVGGLIPEVWEHCLKTDLVAGDGAMVALSGLANAEQHIAHKLSSMLAHQRKTYPVIDTEGLAADQLAAAKAIETANVFVLTGAPGTGKTYTIGRIVQSLLASGKNIGLCAPTGKAAKQMSIALGGAGLQAVTIHSLLAPTVHPETNEFMFSRNESEPLEFDTLIVDEMSMVDVMLFRSLLRAVPESCRLLLVGDHYQLPSIGPGAVLRDLLAAGVPSYELKEIKRNAGRIVLACHQIKDGRVPIPSERLNLPFGENWRHISAVEPSEIKDIITSLLSDVLPERGVNLYWGVQIVSPVNDAGALSCDALNTLSKDLLNPNSVLEGEEKGKLKFSVGDKVVRTKNGIVDGSFTEEGAPPYSGEVRIVNGDLGIVRAIDDKKITVDLRYPQRTVILSREEHHLKLAYCLTGHKMQGSEVDVVITPICSDFARLPMVTREWIYTLMSRAKVFLITVGSLAALPPIIRRVGNTKRLTALQALLKQRLTGGSTGKPEFDDL